MPDRFADLSGGLDSPATHGFTITPSDGIDLAETTRAIYVGSGGTLVVVFASGAEVSLPGVASGSVLAIRARRVKATGTAASGLVGLV